MNAYVAGEAGLTIQFNIFTFLCNPDDYAPIFFTYEGNTISYESPDFNSNGVLSTLIAFELTRPVHKLYSGNTWENIQGKRSMAIT